LPPQSSAAAGGTHRQANGRAVTTCQGIRMNSQNRPTRRAFLAGVGAASLTALAPTAGATAVAPTGDKLSRALRQSLSTGKSSADNAVVPPLAVRALHRMGYGPARRKVVPQAAVDASRIFGGGFESSQVLGSDDIAHFMSLGSDDDTRLANYVEEQLNPANIPDTELTARFAQNAPAFAVMNQGLAPVFAARECNGFDNYARPYREVEKAAFTRAVYSKRQLGEVMAEFWHSHFNIFAGADEDIYVSWHSWDRDVIRAHSFGNFYTLLEASAHHPAMLEYLDNYENSKAGFNENYARELFELHTLGAENYRGLQLPLTVEALATNPYAGLGDADLDNANYGGGIAIADPARSIARYYVDSDVYEAARALTGWRYSDQDQGGTCGTGAFFVVEDDHDIAAKSVLGRGLGTHRADLTADLEGRLVLKMAAYHPGTANYIARKLCTRLISDDPPESVVQAAAATFYANRKAPDQIKRTLRTILLSPEFKDPQLWGSKVKRPFEYVVSAMRAAGLDYTFRMDDASNTTNDFLNLYNLAGQRLYWWRTPDGYPDARTHWQGTNTLVQAWRTIDWLLDRNADNQATRVMRVIDITLDNIVGNPTARQVVEFWCNWIIGFTPDGGWTGPAGTAINSAPTVLGRAALKFFTQSGFAGLNDRAIWPADDEPITRTALAAAGGQYEWHVRLRGLVALIVWSPNFLQR
jgi:uncharacterized protein (DUF1800 family)